jgi:hypothetical protein
MEVNLLILISKKPLLISKRTDFRNTIVPSYEKPTPRSVMLIDGSKTIHASTIYKPKFRPPILSRDAKNELVFSSTKEGDETWELRSNDKILRK